MNRQEITPPGPICAPGHIKLGLWFCAIAAIPALCFGAKFALVYGFAWQCPVMALFHVPCPSCGSTRALAALSNLQLGTAFRFNPLFVSALLSAPLAFIFRERLGRFVRWGWTAFAIAVMANWVYLLLFLPR